MTGVYAAVILLLVCFESCWSNIHPEGRKKTFSPLTKPIHNEADLLEVALHQLRETESQKDQDKFLRDVMENDPNILKSKEKLQVLHKEHERITRLVKEQEDGAREEVSSGKRKEATSYGEVLTEDGLINSEGEVQTVKRKDENAKKKDKHLLSNPTYQFFLIAVLVFSGVGVFIAISVAIVYLVKRIKDDGRRRNTIEMDDKGHVGLYYYQCSDSSNYSHMGSGCTSHSHLSDDVNRYGAQDDIMSPFSEDESNYGGGRMTGYNGHAMPPLPGKSWTTRVQPEDKAQQYGTFYNLNRSSSADNRKEISKMAEEYHWNMTSSTDGRGLLNVLDNKRPKSY